MCVILGTQEGYIWTGDNGSFHLERILPSWRKTAEYVKVTATRVTYAAILTDHIIYTRKIIQEKSLVYD